MAWTNVANAPRLVAVARPTPRNGARGVLTATTTTTTTTTKTTTTTTRIQNVTTRNSATPTTKHTT
eukprot:3919402-Lingulodinium_polyedra.AAC.1